MRAKIAQLGRSRAVLIALVTVAVLAVAGTTVGYASMNKSLTLSLDGQAREVDALGSTVGDVLASEGIEIDEHDVVAPGLDEQVSDGDRISVRFGRELTLEVDGEKTTHWVTATNVQAALGQIGRLFGDADLSASRGSEISREGMLLEVVTPKRIQVKIADGRWQERNIAALTVADVFRELGVRFDDDDRAKPGFDALVDDGDKVVLTKMRVVTKSVDGEVMDFDTVERSDSSMYEGEENLVREGRTGLRDVTYRLTFRNGELVLTKVLRQDVKREPVDAIVEVGTKEQPTANYASGSTVWDQLAQCESGGNWAINTGNGYYGGLQFSLSTWRAYGGAGYPHQQSREYQISIAEKVRAATGGYGSWPHCSSVLGLPQ